MIQILLIHNPFKPKEPITYLSFLIQVITGSPWNHLVVRDGDIIYESVMDGVISYSYDKWYAKGNRRVLPLAVLIDVDILEIKKLLGQKYGKLQLVIVGIRILLEYRFNIKWDGIDVPGWICTELGCVILKIAKVLAPCEFIGRPELLALPEYNTYKK